MTHANSSLVWCSGGHACGGHLCREVTDVIFSRIHEEDVVGCQVPCVADQDSSVTRSEYNQCTYHDVSMRSVPFALATFLDD